MLAPDRWSRARAVLQEAVALPPVERRVYVAGVCRSEPDIRGEVESLLEAHEAASGFLEPDLAALAAGAGPAEAPPALVAGTRLGAFEILAPLGAGGMGQVYRARDTRLDRQVAIKVLLPARAVDARYRERFEREARAISRLAHPHICVLHDVGRADAGDGTARQFLVMELVEGETLRSRLARGPLPVGQALTYGIQIAEALAAAHAQGIVHRDLKPANIMLTKTGVKLLDFGLARLGRINAAIDAGIASRELIGASANAGTLPYMSPEQVRGEAADARSDVFAFGAVLYEMLTARRAFASSSRADLTAAILERDPPRLADHLPNVPPALDRLVTTCLARDPAERWQHAFDMVLALRGIEERPAGTPHTAGRSRLWPWAAAAIVLVVVSAAAGRFWRPTPGPPVTRQPVMRLDLDLEPGGPLGSMRAGPAVAISPNGERLVFVANGRLMTRHLDRPVSVPLDGTEGVASGGGAGGLTFFFSPDSETIAFVADRKLQRVALDGGPVTTICDVPPEVRGGSWGEGDTIVFADATGGLMRVWAGGGPAEPLTRLDPGEFSHRWPQILPGGKAVVFSSNTAPDWWTRARIDVVSLDDGRRRRLQDRATFGRFVVDSDGTGFITFVRAGTLFAAAFDPIRLELRSAPFPVLEQVAPDISGGAQVDGSRTGAVLTRVQPRVSIVWLDGSGPSPLLAEPGDYQGPELSHDGNRVAFSSGEDLWVYDVQRAVRTQLTKGLGVARPKIWSPDDQFIVFSTPEGIWWVRSDGGSEPRLLLPAKKPAVRIATSMNADRRGSRLGFQQVASDSEARWDLWTAPVHIDATGMRAGEPEPFLKTADNEHTFQFSPDGRWVAYTSTEAGGPNEIHVRAFPDDGRRWKLSERGGLSPRWSHGRSELFFRAGESLMVVPYSVNGGVFNAGNPRAWSRQRLPHYVERGSGPFSVSRDGRRIVTLVADQVADERFRGHVTLWLNAVAEFRRRIPASP